MLLQERKKEKVMKCLHMHLKDSAITHSVYWEINRFRYFVGKMVDYEIPFFFFFFWFLGSLSFSTLVIPSTFADQVHKKLTF